MKKLLVLVLVLAVSAIANADLVGSLTLDEGIVSLNIMGSPADPFYAIAIQGAGTLSGFAAPALVGSDVAGSPAMSFAGLDLVETYGNGVIWTFVDSSDPYVFPDGTWLTAVLSGAVAGDVITGYQYDAENDAFIALGSVTIVPEPITVALLGLGGLFIRRK